MYLIYLLEKGALAIVYGRQIDSLMSKATKQSLRLFIACIPSYTHYSLLILCLFIPNVFVVQVGYDKQGLPIGLQLIGRPWAEASLLRLASAVEVSILTRKYNHVFM